MAELVPTFSQPPSPFLAANHLLFSAVILTFQKHLIDEIMYHFGLAVLQSVAFTRET